jgi:hypothetical protein
MAQQQPGRRRRLAWALLGLTVALVAAAIAIGLARYDADQTVAAFAARLRDAVDLDAVRSDLLTVVTTAVEPAHMSIWTAPITPAAGRTR